MKNLSSPRLIFYSLLFLMLCLSSCQNQEGCGKFMHEKYTYERVDQSLIKLAMDYRETLLERFGETSIKDLHYDVYHLMFYSSHGYGRSIKVEKNDGGYYFRISCLPKEDSFYKCESKYIKMQKDDWDEFEAMIYEFDFWTEEQIRSNTVLDGYVLFLEGNRPEAEKCDKRTHRIVGRGSPRYDKIGSLCDEIFSFSNQITFSYSQSEDGW